MGLENRIVYNLVDVVEGNCRIKQAMIKDKRYSNLFLLPSAQTRDKTSVTPEQMKDYSWRQCAGCGYGLGVRTHMDPAKSGLVCSLGEFGWGGAAGATAIIDPSRQLGVFYAQHCLSPREEYYQPRLRNVVYTCLD
jgi:CubicO group peptidase (beta-lactamase class C family)